MAKVETRVLPKDGKFTEPSEIVRALRGALADELSAQNLYSEIIDYLEKSGYKPEDDTLKRIHEILTDEMNHAGSLLACIDNIDETMGSTPPKLFSKYKIDKK